MLSANFHSTLDARYCASNEGEYHFDCPLDNFFFGFAEIKGDDFKDFVATGATDDEVAEWITQNAKQRERSEIIEWNKDPSSIQIGLNDFDRPDQQSVPGMFTTPLEKPKRRKSEKSQ